MQQTDKWFILSHPGNYQELGKKYGISPVLARIMRNRGIEGEKEEREYLFSGPETLDSGEFSGFNLKDMDKAVEIALKKINEKKKIRIVGDYDIDGITAVFILLKGLRKAGADADYRIPHRVRDGYGLNRNIIEEAKEAGIDTIITCDNGIAAAEETALAKDYGMTVIVTDHHEVPFEMVSGEKREILPKADAIVDPKREGCPYPFKSICGAYVAYKFLRSLYEKAGIDMGEVREFQEIAAFATIGDVMPLKGENRILVKEGLKDLAITDNPGLKALISLNSLTGKKITPYHVGFVLGPCINAAGRLGDADDSLDLLMCEDSSAAHEKAVELNELNISRKNLTDKSVEEALRLADLNDNKNDKVLVLYLPDCHESIAGIVAGRVRERTGKPVFILTPGETFDESPCLKGSGRSIEEYNMFEEMTKVKDVFIKFGGHAMAAGLSLPEDKLNEFRQRLNENTSLKEEDLYIKRYIDMEMPISYVSYELIGELEKLEPYGTDNVKPCFAARDVRISRLNISEKNHNYIWGKITDGKKTLDCKYYGSDAEEIKEYIETHGDKGYKIIYSPEINEYRGERSLQIAITGIKF